MQPTPNSVNTYITTLGTLVIFISGHHIQIKLYHRFVYSDTSINFVYWAQIVGNCLTLSKLRIFVTRLSLLFTVDTYSEWWEIKTTCIRTINIKDLLSIFITQTKGKLTIIHMNYVVYLYTLKASFNRALIRRTETNLISPKFKFWFFVNFNPLLKQLKF